MSGVVIVGGGLAGAAAAAHLAREGRRVHILERDAGPRDKICGEFLSVEAQRHLAALGLDLAPLGGQLITRLRLVSGRRCVESALPFPALGLTRRRLDEALLQHAERLGARIDRGVSVRSLAGRAVESSAGALQPATLMLASGKHEVRGAQRDTAGTLDGLIGFKMYFRVERSERAALDGFIEVVLFPGGYAGLQLVEDGVANLCLLVREGMFAQLGRKWAALLSALMREPHLQRRLGAAEPLLDRPLTISGVPYGFIHRDGPGTAGEVWRLGDQAAVIPSFCGDGMSIALHSARLASTALLCGADPRTYHLRLRRDVGRQVRLSTLLQGIGDGGPGRRALVAALALAPGALAHVAEWTRVSEAALRRAGLTPARDRAGPDADRMEGVRAGAAVPAAYAPEPSG